MKNNIKFKSVYKTILHHSDKNVFIQFLKDVLDEKYQEAYAERIVLLNEEKNLRANYVRGYMMALQETYDMLRDIEKIDKKIKQK